MLNRSIVVLKGVLVFSALALGQKVWAQATWTGGGGSNQNINYGPNWQSGSPPPNNGTQTATLNEAANATINVNANENVAGIVFTGAAGDSSQYSFNDDGGALTIGSGGISFTSLNNANLYFGASIVLSANQTWTLGFINQYEGIISGNFSLTTTGADYMFGDNTFTGGLNVISGNYYIGSGSSAGTGTITLSGGATLGTYFSAATLTNAVVLGSDVGLSSGASTPLTLTGPISFTSGTTTLNLPQNTQLYLTGTVGGSTATSLTVSGLGQNPILPVDGGAQVVISGALNNVTGLTVSGSQVIFAPTGSASAALASLTPSALNVGVGGDLYGYLGLDGTFASGGAVSGFISTYGPTLGPSIVGTLGFDTTANPSSPQTFSDPIDLSQFSSSSFLGLGSATSAILSGAITPTPGNAYVFGGGGGTLTLTHDLEDYGGTQLTMTPAPAPVTVIVQGANDYTGPIQANGGVLVFDSTVLPTGTISLGGGYVGYTGTPGITPAEFIAMFANYGNGVVGFDQSSTICAPIDMSGFNSDSSVFIGTSTNATIMGTITPANEQYLFTGVKGGRLTINTQLVDDGGIPRGVTIGLQYPIESNGSVSVVNLTGDNSYSGGTTFNSGTLFINSNTALGTGPVTMSDTLGTNAPYFASYGGSPVTILNPIIVGNTGDGSVQGVSLGNVDPSGSDMLVLNGVLSDWGGEGPGIVAIGGPVTLGAANTYTGGTIFTGNGSAEALITNSASLGSGPITVQDGSTIAALANVTLANSITLVNGSALTLGQPGNDFVLTLNGIISGSGGVTIDSAVTLDGVNTYNNGTVITGAAVVIGPDTTSPFGTGAVTLENGASLAYATSPTILDLGGDGTASIALSAGQTLTLDADSAGGLYSGAITGDGSNQVVKIDSGIQQLYGTSSYGGGTSVNGGTLIAGASGALGTGPVTVASGAQLGVTNGVTIANAVTLSGGSILSGSGTFSTVAPLTFSGGTTVMPGNPIYGQYVSTLTLTTGVTFGTGGAYILDVADAGGSAGVDYSTLSVGGTLTVTAAANSFTIDLTSISPGEGPGLATFNAALPYTWTIVSAGSISMFNAGDFTIDTGAFQNSLAGGSFSIAQSGNTLTLDFTPVPEPSTWALMAAGLAAVAACALRRRRQGV